MLVKSPFSVPVHIPPFPLQPLLSSLHTPVGHANGREISHSLPRDIRIHLLPSLLHRSQHFEIIDVERRCEGVEELGGDVERVGEGVRRARRDDHVVAHFGVDVLVALGVEAQDAFGYEEGLVMLGGGGEVSGGEGRGMEGEGRGRM